MILFKVILGFFLAVCTIFVLPYCVVVLIEWAATRAAKKAAMKSQKTDIELLLKTGEEPPPKADSDDKNP